MQLPIKKRTLTVICILTCMLFFLQNRRGHTELVFPSIMSTSSKHTTLDYDEIQACLKLKNTSTLKWKFKGTLTEPWTIIKAMDNKANKIEYGNYKRLQNVTETSLYNKINNTYSTKVKLPNATNERGYITLNSIMGRLGNQMFQIAALIGIANFSEHIPILQKKVSPLNDVFDIPLNIYKAISISRFKTYNQGPDANKMDYNSIDWKGNLTLKGYYQVYKPFIHIKDNLKEIFKFKTHFIKRARDFIASTVQKGRVKIGIHVRRGDYLKPAEIKVGRLTPDLDYYKQAMSFYRCAYANVTFIIVSDDKQWCRKNLAAPDSVISNLDHAGADMALMSMCDHAIMSVGTFGWWGGWLAGGNVVYFSEPYTPGSIKDNTSTLENFFPSDWIGLS